MNSGIASSVEQLLGRSLIPASAVPSTRSWMLEKPGPKPKPKPEKTPRPPGPHARLVAALDDEWRPVLTLRVIAKVSEAFAYAQMPQLVAAGVAKERSAPWAKGVRREYRRARG